MVFSVFSEFSLGVAARPHCEMITPLTLNGKEVFVRLTLLLNMRFDCDSEPFFLNWRSSESGYIVSNRSNRSQPSARAKLRSAVKSIQTFEE